MYLSSSSSSSSAGSTSRTTFAFAPPEVRGRLTPAARMGRWFLRRAAAASGAMVYPPLRLRRASRRAARASRASSASFMRASVRFLSSSFGSPPSLCGRDGDGTVEWGGGQRWGVVDQAEAGGGKREASAREASARVSRVSRLGRSFLAESAEARWSTTTFLSASPCWVRASGPVSRRWSARVRAVFALGSSGRGTFGGRAHRDAVTLDEALGDLRL